MFRSLSRTWDRPQPTCSQVAATATVHTEIMDHEYGYWHREAGRGGWLKTKWVSELIANWQRIASSAAANLNPM